MRVSPAAKLGTGTMVGLCSLTSTAFWVLLRFVAFFCVLDMLEELRVFCYVIRNLIFELLMEEFVAPD